MPPKFEDILRLPPELRVKVLRQLEEHLRKLINRHANATTIDERDIQDAQELLERTIQELRVLEEQEALAQSTPAKKKEETPAPRRAETTPRRDDRIKNLEDELKDVQLNTQQELAATVQAQKPLAEAYNQLKSIYENASNVKEMSDYQRNKFYETVGAIEHRIEDANKGLNPLSEREKMMLSTAEKMIKYERAGEDKQKNFYQNG